MKYLFLITIIGFLVISCKSKQTSTISNSTSQLSTDSKTKGVVSHQYKEIGCGSVVVITQNNQSIILIPHPLLDKNFDIDGKKIAFNFRKLRRSNPMGCNVGIPAELKNIE